VNTAPHNDTSEYCRT